MYLLWTQFLVILLSFMAVNCAERKLFKGLHVTKNDCSDCEKELTFTIRGGDQDEIHITTPALVRSDRNTFGPWNCDFYISRKDDPLVHYLSYCASTIVSDQRVAVDGMFSNETCDHHLYYDMMGKMQFMQLEMFDADGSRSLSSQESDGQELNDAISVSERQLTEQTCKPLSWAGRPETQYGLLPDPEIEAGILVDHYFMDFAAPGSDEGVKINEAKRLAYMLVNAANSTYVKLGIKLKVVNFMLIEEEKLVKQNQTLKNYRQFLELIPDYYKRFVNQEVYVNRPQEGKIIGRPDMVITLTHQRIPEDRRYGGYGFNDKVCDHWGHFVINIPVSHMDMGAKFGQNDVFRYQMIHSSGITLAHEAGHVIGLNHVTNKEECKDGKGYCVMWYLADYSNGKWTKEERDNVTRILESHRKNGTCLFKHNVFQQYPDVPAARDSRVTFHAEKVDYADGYFLFLEFEYFSRTILMIQRSLILEFRDGSKCTFFRGPGRETLTAMNFCERENKWSGDFEYAGNRVKLIPIPKHHREWDYNVSFSTVSFDEGETQLLPAVGETAGFVITVLVGMDNSFVTTTGDIDQAIHKIVSGIHIADTSFRKIAIIVKATAFHYFESDETIAGKFLEAGKYYRDNKRTENAFLLFTASPEAKSSANLIHSHHQPCAHHNVTIISHQDDDYAFGVEIAHQIGHILGLEDDDETSCPCYTSVGTCVMSRCTESRSVLWSNCSFDHLNRLNDAKCIHRIRIEEDTPAKKRMKKTVLALRTILTIIVVTYLMVAIFTIIAFSDGMSVLSKINKLLRRNG